jgi:hypothetical protein
LEAARAEAFEDWSAAETSAGSAWQTVTSGAMKVYEMSRAAADAVFAVAEAAVDAAGWLASASSAVGQASSRASQLHAQAAGGSYRPTLSDLPTLASRSIWSHFDSTNDYYYEGDHIPVSRWSIFHDAGPGVPPTLEYLGDVTAPGSWGTTIAERNGTIRPLDVEPCYITAWWSYCLFKPELKGSDRGVSA